MYAVPGFTAAAIWIAGITIVAIAYWMVTAYCSVRWVRFGRRGDFAFFVAMLAVLVAVLWHSGLLPHTYAFFYACYYTCNWDYGVVWGGQLVDWWGDFINWI